MPRLLNKVLLVGLSLFWMVSHVSAQEDPVTETTTDDSKTKWSYLRIWNFAGRSDTQRTGIFLRKKGDPTAPVVWLARGVRYGVAGKYRNVPEGSYDLLILTEPEAPVDPDKPFKVDPQQKNHVENVNVILKENGYQTLLIQDKDNKLDASVMDDLAVKSGLLTLRAFNFTDSPDISIDRLSPVKNETVFKTLEKGKVQTKEISGGGMIQFEMTCYDSKGYPLTQSAELDSSGLLGASLLVFYDRYGRLTFRCYGDAPSRR